MKDLLKKHSLLMHILAFIFIAVLLTWVLPECTINDGLICEKTDTFKMSLDIFAEDNKLGLFDVATYSFLSFKYFPMTLAMVLTIFGFYTLLGKLNNYSKLTDNIAYKFKYHEKLFISLVILILSVLSSVMSYPLVVFAFVPFIISIASKMKLEKVSSISMTVGSILLGMMCSTYSLSIVGILNNAKAGLGIKFGYDLLSVGILYILGYFILRYFTVSRLNLKKSECIKDLFDSKEKINKSESTLSLGIILGVLSIITILAFIGWDRAFGITLFKDIHNDIINSYLFHDNVHIFSMLLGKDFTAFGESDPYYFCGLVIIITLIIKLMYKIKFEDLINTFVDGLKLAIKPLIVLSLSYSIILFAAMYPKLPGLLYTINGNGNPNVFGLFNSGFVTSLFACDFQYMFSLISRLFTSYTGDNIVAAFVAQVSYGFASFIAPTSAILVLGLSMYDIKFSEWIKFIYKFLLTILLVIVLILLIIAVI